MYFDSNTQAIMKKQLYPSDSSNFPPLHWRNPANGLTVTQAVTFISYVYTTLHRLTSMVDGKDDDIKRRQERHKFPPSELLQNRKRFL